MDNKIAHQQCQDLLDFIDESPSPWHAVSTVEQRLHAFNFQRLYENQDWALVKGGRYYLIRDDSSIVIFKLGLDAIAEQGFKILGAHTDSPGLRVKPKPVLNNESVQRLALEVYGGPILATFTDRDLSLAGRVAYADEQGVINTRLVKFSNSLIRLPNLPIHLNRSVNEDGLKLHKQSELIGFFADNILQQLPTDYFFELLAKQVGLTAKQILSWDLAVYDTQKGGFWGVDQAFYANSQLDNLASCHAGLTSLLTDSALNNNANLVCAFFDHEEIGSESCKGAGSSLLIDVLQRIVNATGSGHDDYQKALANSFMVSADMAHAYQANYPNVFEPNHKVLVNHGPVIKINSNQRYASEAYGVAQFSYYCQQAQIPYQHYAHRGDLACGSTIGPMTAAKLGVRAVDVGCPMWAMHSLRESAGVLDHYYMIKVLQTFFSV